MMRMSVVCSMMRMAIHDSFRLTPYLIDYIYHPLTSTLLYPTLAHYHSSILYLTTNVAI